MTPAQHFKFPDAIKSLCTRKKKKKKNHLLFTDNFLKQNYHLELTVHLK